MAGCINLPGQQAQPAPEKNAQTGTNFEIELYKAQVDKAALQEKYDAATADLRQCLADTAACEGKPAEKCPAPENCDAIKAERDSALSRLSTCIDEKAAIAGSTGTCNSALSTCLSDKSGLTTSLATCTADKSALQLSLTAAQNAVPNTTVWHYAPGNLGAEGGTGYRTTDYKVPSSLKKALIGLDYSGGSDAFFGPGVVSGLVRWYTMTSVDGVRFSSDIDDTVVIDLSVGNPLKVKTVEFAAGTSKEGFALKRVIAIYIQ
ncbi:MAG: hypothetical protein Q7T16_02445 [Candidatus Burarchaeum sp.]|nr:hypothetical protein [Candidatus Burarchaeum sp.]MDO8339494.1 hypothetical protein [Candidatus Burarchaeum sp.]